MAAVSLAPPHQGPMHALAKSEVPQPRAIIDRRALMERLDEPARGRAAGDQRAPALAAFKEALAAGRAEIRRRFEANRDARSRGRDATKAYAYLVDQLIRALYDGLVPISEMLA